MAPWLGTITNNVRSLSSFTWTTSPSPRPSWLSIFLSLPLSFGDSVLAWHDLCETLSVSLIACSQHMLRNLQGFSLTFFGANQNSISLPDLPSRAIQTYHQCLRRFHRRIRHRVHHRFRLPMRTYSRFMGYSGWQPSFNRWRSMS